MFRKNLNKVTYTIVDFIYKTLVAYGESSIKL